MSFHKGIWDALESLEDESLAPLAEATRGRMEAQGRWERALRDARKSHSLREIAPAAGVSHSRVAQILSKDVVDLVEAYTNA